jgi:uncharacterized protein (TIGR03435 family)
MTHAGIRLLIAVVVTATASQAPERLPSFEVASVKQNVSGGDRMQMVTRPGGRFIATNAPLKLWIADAFLGGQPLGPSRVLGGPDWIDSARYDINAKASAEFQQPPAGGPSPELLQMLRSLLEERFKLKAHRETRELPIYELVVAREDGRLGSQLRQSTIDCDAVLAARRAGAPPPPRQPMEPPPSNAMRGPARIISGGIAMPQFATMVTMAMADAMGPAGRDMGRLVVDKTGLTGRFEFLLAWTPEVMPTGAPPPGVPPIDPDGPSFVTALQEQLGLKLRSARGPVEVIVIDSIDRPTPN